MAEQLLSTGPHHKTLPESYIRSESERPKLSQVHALDDIPVIDLGHPCKGQIVAAIAVACKSHGFFQVVNHGISDELIKEMMAVAREFFHLSAEEKARLYSDDPTRTVRLSTSFNIRKEKVRNWRDYLRLHCYPLDKYLVDWPSKPAKFK